MTKYREIIRLAGLDLSQSNIALSCNVSKTTINKTLCMAPGSESDRRCTAKMLFQEKTDTSAVSHKRMPDYEYIRKELLRNRVNKKLLWTEYLENCKRAGDDPLMYSQFCYYIQQDEQKRRATMHINRKPGEQVEVDRAGDAAHIIDPDTGEIINAWLFLYTLAQLQEHQEHP